MKTLFVDIFSKGFLVIILFFSSNLVYSQTIDSKVSGQGFLTHENRSNSECLISKKTVEFVENRGQVVDENNKPVSSVLFEAICPNMNVFITEKGITYVHVRLTENKVSESNIKNDVTKFKSKIMPFDGTIEQAWVNIQLEGVKITKDMIITEHEGVSDYNFYSPSDGKMICGLKGYKKICVKNVYPGIDWVIYNSEKNGLKYDFVVHPGANYKKIRMICDSESPVEMNKQGGLVFKTALGSIIEDSPLTYFSTSKAKIKSGFKLLIRNKHTTEISFDLDDELLSDKSEFVIDPQVSWGSFIGSTGAISDNALSITKDQFGNVYLAGIGARAGWPFVNPGGGSYYSTAAGSGFFTGFVMKFNNAGAIVWSTTFGNTYITNMVCDQSGNLFCAGSAYNNWTHPLINPGGGAFFQSSTFGSYSDGMIAKFSNTGVLTWSTKFGGTDEDAIYGMTLDNSGNLFVVGRAGSIDLPVLNPGGGAYFDNTLGNQSDGFLAKFSNSGVLLWSTYFGGDVLAGSLITEALQSITTDASGNILVCGVADSFDFPVLNPGGGAYFNNMITGSTEGAICRFSNNGQLQWSTLYGGGGSDFGYDIETNSNNEIFVVSLTTSSNVPVYNPGGGAYFDNSLGGVSDFFLSKFNGANLTPIWGTYVGGPASEDVIGSSINMLAISSCNDLYLSFSSGSSSGLPIQSLNSGCGGYNDNSLGGTSDVFVNKFTSTGQLIWGSYIGGSVADYFSGITLTNNSLYLVGSSSSAPNNVGYPLLNPGGGAYFDNTPNGSTDIFIGRFIPSTATYSQSQTDATLYPCNGSATATVTCGEPPFNYVWSNGTQTLNSLSNTNTLSGLCAGNYSLSITSNCATTVLNYTINGLVPLPVQVTDFEVELLPNNDGSLTWKTQSERENDYFTMLKSYDGIVWETLGVVAGQGESSSVQYYEMIDENTQVGLNYYQLLQTDFNGTSHDIGIRVLNRYAEDLYIMPNPSSGSMTIGGLDLKNECTINVYNNLGQLVAQSHNSNKLNIENLANGIYTIVVVMNTSTKSLRCEIQD